MLTLRTHRMNSLSTPGTNAYDGHNCALVFGTLAGISLLIAAVFAVLGAWLILPFAGLEALALYATYCWIMRHAHDAESLVICGNEVTLAVREEAHTRHYEFNRAWARVVVAQRGWEIRITLRSHGREVEVGRYLDGSGRRKLAQELNAWLQTK